MKKRTSVKLDKSANDWVLAIYSDYGQEGVKRLVRASYSLESGARAWEKFSKIWGKSGYRCWQENKKGKIVNEYNPERNRKSILICSHCRREMASA